jgi:hypothetical protein
VADVADHFKHLRNRYRAVFCGDDGKISPAGEVVIDNLRQMTKHGTTPFSSDPVQMAYNVGQQDIFRHLMQMLNISDAEIHRLTASMRPNVDEEGAFGSDY